MSRGSYRSCPAWAAWPAAVVLLWTAVPAAPAAADIRPNDNLVVDGTRKKRGALRAGTRKTRRKLEN